MQVAANQDERSIDIRLGEAETQHLLSILLHAKFNDDVRLEVVGSPTTQALLRGLIQARQELGFDRDDSPSWRTIQETGGLRAPPSFRAIELELKRLLNKDDVAAELREYLYPFEWIKTSSKDQP